MRLTVFQITMVGSHADWGGAFTKPNPTKTDLSIIGAAKGPVEE
jgi:hypothetical protein